MKVYGPDGRIWTIARRPDPPGPFATLRVGGQWVVEAVTDDETRRWVAASRRAAGQLVHEVALSLRTGGEGPAGELPPDEGADELPPDGGADEEPPRGSG